MKDDRVQVGTYYIARFAARAEAYAIWTDKGRRTVLKRRRDP